MMDNIESEDANIYGIDVNHGTYKVVEKEVGLPNTFVINSGESGGTDNIIAIIAIFMVIMVLTGIICFIFGSSVGGGIGYNHGKKSQIKDEKRMKRRKNRLINMDESV